MNENLDPNLPVYKIADRMVSIHELLKQFSDVKFMRGGIPRFSDLHLKTGEAARYRFDGKLVPIPKAAPLDGETVWQLARPLLRDDHVARLQGPGPADLDAAYEWKEEMMNFRINAFQDRDGLALTIRVLPSMFPPIEKIGFPADRTWKELVELNQGLVIVTGITGSGKSTTIASIIQRINATQQCRIITLEDPIEYLLRSDRSLISQRELGKHIQAFHEGLKSALREDPDIIFVGEIRDRETAALALTAAETGHLVFTTLHTRDARGAITRLVDLFPPERSKELCAQISFSLSHIIAQKLIPRRDGEGRIVAMEVLKNIAPIANHIRTGQWHQIYSALETHYQDGLHTMDRHLRELIESGAISREEALRHAVDPAALQSY